MVSFGTVGGRSTQARRQAGEAGEQTEPHELANGSVFSKLPTTATVRLRSACPSGTGAVLIGPFRVGLA